MSTADDIPREALVRLIQKLQRQNVRLKEQYDGISIIGTGRLMQRMGRARRRARVSGTKADGRVRHRCVRAAPRRCAPADSVQSRQQRRGDAAVAASAPGAWARRPCAEPPRHVSDVGTSPQAELLRLQTANAALERRLAESSTASVAPDSTSPADAGDACAPRPATAHDECQSALRAAETRLREAVDARSQAELRLAEHARAAEQWKTKVPAASHHAVCAWPERRGRAARTGWGAGGAAVGPGARARGGGAQALRRRLPPHDQCDARGTASQRDEVAKRVDKATKAIQKLRQQLELKDKKVAAAPGPHPLSPLAADARRCHLFRADRDAHRHRARSAEPGAGVRTAWRAMGEA
jgi:hypothetical protein